ncbi:MAG: ATP-binding protein [Thermoprotei archaeon]
MLKSTNPKVRVIREGIRWFGFTLVEIKPRDKASQDGELLQRFVEGMRKAGVNYAFLVVGRHEALPLNPPRSGGFLLVYSRGFSKRRVVENVKRSSQSAKSLAEVAGLDVKPVSEAQGDGSAWLLQAVFRNILEAPMGVGEEAELETLKLGRLVGGGEFTLGVEDVYKHVVVLGETGSGKSSFVAKLITAVSELGTHFLVFDWHGEYSTLLRDSSTLVIAPDQDLGFDIFDYPRSVDPFVHIDVLMDIFTDSFDLSVSQQFVLRSALRRVFTDKGHGMGGDVKPVTVEDVIRSVNELRTYSGWEQESKLAVLRRISKLADTGLSRMLNASQKIGFNDLLGENVVVDLGQVTDNYSKIFVVEAILKLLYDYKVSRKLVEPHVIAVEEARNIVPYRRAEEPPSIIERLVEEMRKFGEGMVMVNQLPSTLSQEVLSAAGSIVTFRLKGAAEYDILSKRCGIAADVCQKLADLPVGRGVCRHPNSKTEFFEF